MNDILFKYKNENVSEFSKIVPIELPDSIGNRYV